MKLESVVKQIISEQVTPIQVMLKLIKGLGKKGAAEAESALIRAIRKEGNFGPKVPINPSAVGEEIFMKSVANIEFASYRKLLTQKIYNSNQQLYDDIIEKYSGAKWRNKQRIVELNNAGILPVLQPEVKELYNLKNKIVKPTSTLSPTPSNVPIENLSKSEVWDYFRSEMKNLKVVNKLNPEQGKLFIDELQSSIEKHIQKNGQKFDFELSKLKTQFENIKSPVDRKKLLEQTHKSIDELGVKRNLSQRTIGAYKRLITDVEKLPIQKLQTGIWYSTAVSMLLDGIRWFDNDVEEFEGHLGAPMTVSSGGKVAVAYLGYVLLRYNPLGFLVSVGLAIESIVRFAKYGTKKWLSDKPGTAPFTSDGTGNTDDLEGIKN